MNGITIEKKNGAYHLSTLLNGYLFRRTYIFYTKEEAIERFKQEIIGNQNERNN